MRTNRFIIGIGSQRAGTTLLHSLLQASTNIFMHPIKELHYFDTLFGVRSAEELKEFSRAQLSIEICRLAESRQHDYIDDRYKCFIRTADILANTDINLLDYQKLYQPFLCRSSLLGEVTPEYMRLKSDQVKKMREVIGGDAGIILLCRDPVDRLVSAVKLHNSYNNFGMNNQELGRWLLAEIANETGWMRAQLEYNDYESAIRTYSELFPRFLAVHFTELVQRPRRVATKIEKKLLVPVNKKIFSQGVRNVVNRLGEKVELDPSVIDAIRNLCQPSHSFLGEYFRS
jgi:hypothetical protein